MTVVVARYILADLLRSQRFLVPVFAYLALLGVTFGGDPGPAPGSWGASVLALFPISVWLAITTANAEDPVARDITIAAAGGAPAVARGVLAVCLLADVVLAVVSALRPVIPLITLVYPYTPSQLLSGALAHLGAAAAGTAVGLLCARPVITRPGWSLLVTGTVVLLTAITPWLPPVGTTVRALAHAPMPTVSAAAGAALGIALAVSAMS